MGLAEPCALLEDILRTALGAVEGRALVREHLSTRAPSHAPHVIAIGKAASSMLLGVLDVVPDVRALLVTKDGHVDPALRGRARIQVIESAHPVPDKRSLAAGSALLDFIAATPRDAALWVLISGGASSQVEVLPEGVSLADWQRANTWLLASGLDIHAVNAVRKGLSRIKGGRLLEALQGRPAEVMLISDVPGDDPASIGSGLLVASALLPLPHLPDWIRDLLAQAPPVPGRDDPRWAGVHVHLLAGNAEALAAAAEAGRAAGLPVHCAYPPLEGDAAEAGRAIVRSLLSGPPGLHLWGGETTVALAEHPGRGGRNQHLALSAAIALAGTSNITLLAAGTDGTDGRTAEAGACVGGGTVADIRARGIDPADALRRCDSGTTLSVVDALIRTGPTGTNVMDLVLALVRPS